MKTNWKQRLTAWTLALAMVLPMVPSGIFPVAEAAGPISFTLSNVTFNGTTLSGTIDLSNFYNAKASDGVNIILISGDVYDTSNNSDLYAAMHPTENVVRGSIYNDFLHVESSPGSGSYQRSNVAALKYIPLTEGYALSYNFEFAISGKEIYEAMSSYDGIDSQYYDKELYEYYILVVGDTSANYGYEKVYDIPRGAKLEADPSFWDIENWVYMGTEDPISCNIGVTNKYNNTTAVIDSISLVNESSGTTSFINASTFGDIDQNDLITSDSPKTLTIKTSPYNDSDNYPTSVIVRITYHDSLLTSVTETLDVVVTRVGIGGGSLYAMCPEYEDYENNVDSEGNLKPVELDANGEAIVSIDIIYYLLGYDKNNLHEGDDGFDEIIGYDASDWSAEAFVVKTADDPDDPSLRISGSGFTASVVGGSALFTAYNADGIKRWTGKPEGVAESAGEERLEYTNSIKIKNTDPSKTEGTLYFYYYNKTVDDDNYTVVAPENKMAVVVPFKYVATVGNATISLTKDGVAYTDATVTLGPSIPATTNNGDGTYKFTGVATGEYTVYVNGVASNVKCTVVKDTEATATVNCYTVRAEADSTTAASATVRDSGNVLTAASSIVVPDGATVRFTGTPKAGYGHAGTWSLVKPTGGAGADPNPASLTGSTGTPSVTGNYTVNGTVTGTVTFKQQYNLRLNPGKAPDGTAASGATQTVTAYVGVPYTLPTSVAAYSWTPAGLYTTFDGWTETDSGIGTKISNTTYTADTYRAWGVDLYALWKSDTNIWSVAIDIDKDAGAYTGLKVLLSTSNTDTSGPGVTSYELTDTGSNGVYQGSVPEGTYWLWVDQSGSGSNYAVVGGQRSITADFNPTINYYTVALETDSSSVQSAGLYSDNTHTSSIANNTVLWSGTTVYVTATPKTGYTTDNPWTTSTAGTGATTPTSSATTAPSAATATVTSLTGTTLFKAKFNPQGITITKPADKTDATYGDDLTGTTFTWTVSSYSGDSYSYTTKNLSAGVTASNFTIVDTNGANYSLTPKSKPLPAGTYTATIGVTSQNGSTATAPEWTLTVAKKALPTPTLTATAPALATGTDGKIKVDNYNAIVQTVTGIDSSKTVTFEVYDNSNTLVSGTSIDSNGVITGNLPSGTYTVKAVPSDADNFTGSETSTSIGSGAAVYTVTATVKRDQDAYTGLMVQLTTSNSTDYTTATTASESVKVYTLDDTSTPSGVYSKGDLVAGTYYLWVTRTQVGGTTVHEKIDSIQISNANINKDYHYWSVRVAYDPASATAATVNGTAGAEASTSATTAQLVVYNGTKVTVTATAKSGYDQDGVKWYTGNSGTQTIGVTAYNKEISGVTAGGTAGAVTKESTNYVCTIQGTTVILAQFEPTITLSSVTLTPDSATGYQKLTASANINRDGLVSNDSTVWFVLVESPVDDVTATDVINAGSSGKFMSVASTKHGSATGSSTKGAATVTYSFDNLDPIKSYTVYAVAKSNYTDGGAGTNPSGVANATAYTQRKVTVKVYDDQTSYGKVRKPPANTEEGSTFTIGVDKDQTEALPINAIANAGYSLQNWTMEMGESDTTTAVTAADHLTSGNDETANDSLKVADLNDDTQKVVVITANFVYDNYSYSVVDTNVETEGATGDNKVDYTAVYYDFGAGSGATPTIVNPAGPETVTITNNSTGRVDFTITVADDATLIFALTDLKVLNGSSAEVSSGSDGVTISPGTYGNGAVYTVTGLPAGYKITFQTKVARHDLNVGNYSATYTINGRRAGTSTNVGTDVGYKTNLTITPKPIGASVFVTAPVKNATPETSLIPDGSGTTAGKSSAVKDYNVTDSGSAVYNYTSPVTWKPAVTTQFAGKTFYLATVELTANLNYVFENGGTYTINGENASGAHATITTPTAGSPGGNTVTLTYLFPMTDSVGVTLTTDGVDTNGEATQLIAKLDADISVPTSTGTGRVYYALIPEGKKPTTAPTPAQIINELTTNAESYFTSTPNSGGTTVRSDWKFLTGTVTGSGNGTVKFTGLDPYVKYHVYAAIQVVDSTNSGNKTQSYPDAAALTADATTWHRVTVKVSDNQKAMGTLMVPTAVTGLSSAGYGATTSDSNTVSYQVNVKHSDDAYTALSTAPTANPPYKFKQWDVTTGAGNLDTADSGKTTSTTAGIYYYAKNETAAQPVIVATFDYDGISGAQDLVYGTDYAMDGVNQGPISYVYSPSTPIFGTDDRSNLTFSAPGPAKDSGNNDVALGTGSADALGISIDSTTGKIVGQPRRVGTFTFDMRVTDNAHDGAVAVVPVTLTVDKATPTVTAVHVASGTEYETTAVQQGTVASSTAGAPYYNGSAWETKTLVEATDGTFRITSPTTYASNSAGDQNYTVTYTPENTGTGFKNGAADVSASALYNVSTGTFAFTSVKMTYGLSVIHATGNDSTLSKGTFPTKVYLGYSAGEPVVTLRLKNDGNQPLTGITLSITSSSSGITAGDFTLPAVADVAGMSTSGDITIGINKTGLLAGTHTATLHIEGNSGGTRTADLPLEFVVTPKPLVGHVKVATPGTLADALTPVGTGVTLEDNQTDAALDNNLTPSGTRNYTVDSIVWKTGGGQTATNGSAAAPGTAYTVEVTLKANDNYSFQTDDGTTYVYRVNDEDKTSARVTVSAPSASSGGNTITLTYTFPPTAPTLSVSLEGSNYNEVKVTPTVGYETADPNLTATTYYVVTTTGISQPGDSVLKASPFTGTAQSPVVIDKDIDNNPLQPFTQYKVWAITKIAKTGESDVWSAVAVSDYSSDSNFATYTFHRVDVELAPNIMGTIYAPAPNPKGVKHGAPIDVIAWSYTDHETWTFYDADKPSTTGTEGSAVTTLGTLGGKTDASGGAYPNTGGGTKKAAFTAPNGDANDAKHIIITIRATELPPSVVGIVLASTSGKLVKTDYYSITDADNKDSSNIKTATEDVYGHKDSYDAKFSTATNSDIEYWLLLDNGKLWNGEGSAQTDAIERTSEESTEKQPLTYSGGTNWLVYGDGPDSALVKNVPSNNYTFTNMAGHDDVGEYNGKNVYLAARYNGKTYYAAKPLGTLTVAKLKATRIEPKAGTTITTTVTLGNPLSDIPGIGSLVAQVEFNRGDNALDWTDNAAGRYTYDATANNATKKGDHNYYFMVDMTDDTEYKPTEDIKLTTTITSGHLNKTLYICYTDINGNQVYSPLGVLTSGGSGGPSIRINNQDSSNKDTEYGDTLKANVTGITGTYTYQWQRWNGTGWDNIGSETATATYKAGVDDVGKFIRVVLTEVDGVSVSGVASDANDFTAIAAVDSNKNSDDHIYVDRRSITFDVIAKDKQWDGTNMRTSLYTATDFIVSNAADGDTVTIVLANARNDLTTGLTYSGPNVGALLTLPKPTTLVPTDSGNGNLTEYTLAVTSGSGTVSCYQISAEQKALTPRGTILLGVITPILVVNSKVAPVKGETKGTFAADSADDTKYMVDPNASNGYNGVNGLWKYWKIDTDEWEIASNGDGLTNDGKFLPSTRYQVSLKVNWLNTYTNAKFAEGAGGFAESVNAADDNHKWPASVVVAADRESAVLTVEFPATAAEEDKEIVRVRARVFAPTAGADLNSVASAALQEASNKDGKNWQNDALGATADVTWYTWTNTTQVVPNNYSVAENNWELAALGSAKYDAYYMAVFTVTPQSGFTFRGESGAGTKTADNSFVNFLVNEFSPMNVVTDTTDPNYKDVETTVSSLPAMRIDRISDTEYKVSVVFPKTQSAGLRVQIANQTHSNGDTQYGDTLKAMVDGNMEGGTLTYQWQYLDGTDWKNVTSSGSTGEEFTATKAEVGKYLRVQVTDNKDGAVNKAVSTILTSISDLNSSVPYYVYVDKAKLTLTITAKDKVYDANADATQNTLVWSGMANSDVVKVDTPVLKFVDADKGDNKTVNVYKSGTTPFAIDDVQWDGVTRSYDPRDVYTLEIPEVKASITALQLGWNAFNFTGKVKRYDGTTVVYKDENTATGVDNNNTATTPLTSGADKDAGLWAVNTSVITDATLRGNIETAIRAGAAYTSPNSAEGNSPVTVWSDGNSTIQVTMTSSDGNIVAPEGSFNVKGAINPVKLVVGKANLDTTPSIVLDSAAREVTIPSTAVNGVNSENAKFSVQGYYTVNSPAGDTANDAVTIIGVSDGSSNGITETDNGTNYYFVWDANGSAVKGNITGGTPTGGSFTTDSIEVVYGNTIPWGDLGISVTLDGGGTAPTNAGSVGVMGMTLIYQDSAGWHKVAGGEPAPWDSGTTNNEARLNLKLYLDSELTAAGLGSATADEIQSSSAVTPKAQTTADPKFYVKVTQRPLTVTPAWSLTEKYYDTTSDALGSFTNSSGPVTGSITFTYENIAFSDDTTTEVFVKSGYTAKFSDANAADGKIITIGSATLDGTKANRYKIETMKTTTGNIKPRPVKVELTSPSVLQYSNKNVTVSGELKDLDGSALPNSEKVTVAVPGVYDQTDTVVTAGVPGTPGGVDNVTVTKVTISNPNYTVDDTTGWPAGLKINGSVTAYTTNVIQHVVLNLAEPHSGDPVAGATDKITDTETTAGIHVVPATSMNSVTPTVTWYEDQVGVGHEAVGSFKSGHVYIAVIKDIKAKTADGYSMATNVDFVVNSSAKIPGNTTETDAADLPAKVTEIKVGDRKTDDSYDITVTFAKQGSKVLDPVVVLADLKPEYGKTIEAPTLPTGTRGYKDAGVLKWQKSCDGATFNDLGGDTAFADNTYYQIVAKVTMKGNGEDGVNWKDEFDITKDTTFHVGTFGDVQIPQDANNKEITTADGRKVYVTFTPDPATLTNGAYGDATGYTLTVRFKDKVVNTTDKRLSWIIANVTPPAGTNVPDGTVYLRQVQNVDRVECSDQVAVSAVTWTETEGGAAAGGNFNPTKAYTATFDIHVKDTSDYVFLAGGHTNNPINADFLINNVQNPVGTWIDGATNTEVEDDGASGIKVTLTQNTDATGTDKSGTPNKYYRVQVSFPVAPANQETPTVWGTTTKDPDATATIASATVTKMDGQPWLKNVTTATDGGDTYNTGWQVKTGATTWEAATTGNFELGKTYKATLIVEVDKTAYPGYDFDNTSASDHTEGYINDNDAGKTTVTFIQGTSTDPTKPQYMVLEREFTVDKETVKVKITSDAPSAGGAVPVVGNATPHSTLVKGGWYANESGTTPATSFTNGETYYMIAKVRPDDGYTFPETTDKSGYIWTNEGRQAKFVKNEDGTYTVRFEYTVGGGSSGKKTGEVPGNALRPTRGQPLSDGWTSENFTVESFTWTNGTTHATVAVGSTAAASTTYTATIKVKPKDGITVTDDAIKKFNSNALGPTQWSYDDVNNIYTLTYTFPATEATPPSGGGTPSGPSGTITVTKEPPVVYYKLRDMGVTNDLTAEKLENEGDKPKAVPKVTPLDGLKFLGWSETEPKEGVTPTLVDPTTFSITQDKVFYAVYDKTAVEQPEEFDHNHYVIGFPDGTFGPEAFITRAQVATIVARACLIGFEDGGNYGNPGRYTDISDHWAYSAIAFCALHGVMSGYHEDDGTITFRPEQFISRQELANVVARLGGLKSNQGLPFIDVAGTYDWALDSIYTVYSNGWMRGYQEDDGTYTFRPANYITRAETVTVFNGFLHRGVDAEGLSKLRAYTHTGVASHNTGNGYDEYMIWPDVVGHWAYYEILEAGNDHNYHWQDETTQEPPEKWDQAYIDKKWRYTDDINDGAGNVGHAALQAVTYVVKFNGRIVDSVVRLVEQGTTPAASSVPNVVSNSGWQFVGWSSTDPDVSGVMLVQPTSVVINEPRYFYAVFEYVPEVTQQPAESTQPSESPAPAESAQPSESPAPAESAQPSESPAPAESAQPSESPAPTESTQPGESPAPTESTQPSESPAPTESAEPVQVNVTYVIKSEGIVVDSVTKQVDQGSAPAEDDVPSAQANDGWNFLGWSTTDPDEGNYRLVEPSSVTIEEDTIFYAVFEKVAEPQTETPKNPRRAYISGFEDGTFRPDAPLNRSAAAKLLADLKGGYDPSRTYDTSTFTDLDDHWARNIIGYCIQEGLMSGYLEDDGTWTFRADNGITRQELACAMCKLTGETLRNQGLPFADASDVAEWALDGVYTAYTKGWMTGYEDGLFHPEMIITRAAAVKLLNNYLGRQADPDTIRSSSGYTTWSDVPTSHWAYYEIIEASNDWDL